MALADRRNPAFVSVAAAWEIAIKRAIAMLRIAQAKPEGMATATDAAAIPICGFEATN